MPDLWHEHPSGIQKAAWDLRCAGIMLGLSVAYDEPDEEVGRRIEKANKAERAVVKIAAAT